ncbi:MAG: hypothetical protein N2314_06200 [Brevinematales bacterium]|nr:hypothetical protein [Brevinematales bacterium]
MRYRWFWILVVMRALAWGEFVIDEPGSGGKSPSSPRAVFGEGGGFGIDMLGTVNTFDTLGRGVFAGKVALYEKGGFGFRFQVGIFDVLDIGISEGIENVIGVGNPEFFIPGAYAKLQIIKNLSRFHWAVGFDTFGYGRRSLVESESGTRDMLYGFYSVAGWKFWGLGSEDYVVLGLRVPLLPASMRRWEAVSLMGGVSMHLGKYFFLSATVEHVYFVQEYAQRLLPTLIVGFMPSENFELQVLFEYLSEVNAFHRSLIFGYRARF